MLTFVKTFDFVFLFWVPFRFRLSIRKASQSHTSPRPGRHQKVSFLRQGTRPANAAWGVFGSAQAVHLSMSMLVFTKEVPHPKEHQQGRSATQGRSSWKLGVKSVT